MIMTAREMFEELGFKLCKKNDDKLVYSMKEYDGYECYVSFITFLLKEKLLSVSAFFDINIPTMKAIIKQCEELGWL